MGDREQTFKDNCDKFGFFPEDYDLVFISNQRGKERKVHLVGFTTERCILEYTDPVTNKTTEYMQLPSEAMHEIRVYHRRLSDKARERKDYDLALYYQKLVKKDSYRLKNAGHDVDVIKLFNYHGSPEHATIHLKNSSKLKFM